MMAGLAGECTEVVRWLAEAQPEVAARCIDESGARVGGRDELLRELQRAWQARLLGEARPEARAAIGRVLGRFGLDSRKGVGAPNGVPDIDWVEIPAGPFLYQKETKPRRGERFFLSRYPVTNAQFQAFLDADEKYKREAATPGWTRSA